MAVQKVTVSGWPAVRRRLRKDGWAGGCKPSKLRDILKVQSSWNMMAHGDAREGKWSGKWRMEWEASTIHTISEHGVSSITTADAHTSAASSQLNWRPRRFKWTRPFRRKTKSGFCACAITFQTQSTTLRRIFLTNHKPRSYKSWYTCSWGVLEPSNLFVGRHNCREIVF